MVARGARMILIAKNIPKGAKSFMAPSTLHYYGAQSRPQTKKSQPCQPALTPCWDVNRCQD